jgi:hypothetical protein
VGAEQRQQKRDFFLRTDLDHDDLLFAWLVEASGKGVQDNRVSGLFQDCFVEQWVSLRSPPCCGLFPARWRNGDTSRKGLWRS